MSSNGNAYHKNYEAPFTLLTAGKPRWRSFTAGFGVEFLVLACALWLPLLFPKQMEAAKQYMVTEITAPPVEAWKPQPKVQPKAQPVKRAEVAKVTPPPIPDPPKPKMIEPAFKPIMARPVVRRNPTTAPQVNVFARAVPDKPTTSLGSSAAPDLKRPKAPVQTGGFGDPEGLPSKAKMTQPVNIAQAGGFDMPVGPGKGNGTGGAKGAEGVVASAGFGNGTAIAGGVRNGGKVQQGVFADDKANNSGPHVQKTSNTVPHQEGPVILFKPNPVYTAEGKQLKIQGSVVLQVVFRASGEVQVVRVVQGLGHGLDQNAEAAAQKIRYKPAREDGQAVDFPATVRIDFELAY